MSMSIGQYRALLDLLMCSDPWPVKGRTGEGGERKLIEFADSMARELGYDDWIDAYHRLLKGTVSLAAS